MQAASTNQRSFHDMIQQSCAERRFVCLGLDPVYDKLPLSVIGRFDGHEPTRMERAIAFYNFCCQVVDETKDIVAAYKPNTAFFERLGWEGYLMLELLVRHIQRVAPGTIVIIDGKRADIGKTNDGSGVFVFDILGGDALTVNPYFGEEALRPFLDREGKGVIVLCATSNTGADEFQNLELSLTSAQCQEVGLVGDEPVRLYEYVARRVALWKGPAGIAVVVGATKPDKVLQVRAILPHHLFLMPGVGVQGGKLDLAVEAATAHFLINSGSEQLYASDVPNFADEVRAAVMQLNDAILHLVSA